MRNTCQRVSLALLGLLAARPLLQPAGAADQKTRLVVQVLTDETKKPIASAHVVVRVKNQKDALEAQTNKRGELIFEDLPRGPVKIQVIARGYQTFGNNFELTQPEQTVSIQLKPPAKQVSAY